VPDNILGPSGYLKMHQTNLEILVLITDGACDHNMEAMKGSYDVTKFHKVREFSWIGPKSEDDYQTIRQCLTANAEQLEAFRLNIIDWSKADDFWFLDFTRFSNNKTRRTNFFAEDILGVPLDAEKGEYGLTFPALRSLYLGQLSFKSATISLASAFSFSRLKELRL